MGLIATALRCEYRESPLNVDVPRPRLSWVAQSSDRGARGAAQSAYQVIVSAADDKAVWDSGKIASSRTLSIEYAGPALASAQRVSWKVRLWDQDGKAGAWSEPATWTMGILAEDDWKARWIMADEATKAKPNLPIFRRAFKLDKKVSRAVAYVCGLGHHELRVNGKKAGDDMFEPGWTDYRKTSQYVAHDVTALLRTGENAVGVMLGNGMYNVTGGRYAKFKGSFGPPKLILHVHVEFDDGSHTIVTSDESWRVAPGPITFSCIYGGEDYDARQEQSGWDAPGFDDTSWHAVALTNGPGGALVAQTSPPVRAMRTYKPTKFTRPNGDAYVYDLGQNMSGIPRISVGAAAGTKVTLRPGELLDEHGLPSQHATGSPVSFSYTCKGEGEEVWQPRFSYTGFRYLQVEGGPLMSLEADFIHAAAPVVGHFSCSKGLFNRIHDLIDSAILSNLHAVMTDCPHREKLGWLEQAHLMGPSIMFDFDAASFYAKVCRDMRDAQHENGFVPTIAPQYTSFKPPWDVFNDSPEWGSAIVICPWLAYQQYGDTQILADNFAAMSKYVDYLHKLDHDGVIDFGLGDWYDIGEGDPGFSKLTSKALTGTAIYYFDLIVLRKSAEVLGRKDDAERFAAHAERVRHGFLAKLFDPKTKIYDRGSQTACAMPLALGLVSAEDRDAVVERLVKDIRRHDNHITAGDIGFHFVLIALAEAGRSDVIFELLSATDPPSYGSQLEKGATTLTEAWDANPKSSQNHLMLGHAEEWFYRSLAGISVDLSRPPSEQITIRPTPVGDVTWAKASFDSVLGNVSARWEQQHGSLRMNVRIPANCVATVHVPTSDPQSVREAGRPVGRVPGVRATRVQDDHLVVEIESGEYSFEAAFQH